MPFDQQKFEDTFGFAMDKFSLDEMMTDFNLEEEQSDDNFAVYRAVIATKEFNNNYLFLDDDTLTNIAKASNRDTAGADIPIFPNHNRYDFQMGTMLTGEYIKSRDRVEGTFNIIKDPETEILINRINNRVVRGVSPTIRGDVYCDIDGEKMYRYGASKSGYYLGETVKIDGKDRLVTGTFKNAKLVEVSVVSMQAFPGATIFSENKDLLEQAIAEGVIDEKALDMIEYSFSLDLGIKPKKPEPLPPKPEGGDPVPKDADVQILQDKVTDLEAKVAEKDAKIAEFETQIGNMVTAEKHNEIETKFNDSKQKVIETENKLVAAEAIADEYTASIEHVREKAIAMYAKVRNVEPDNQTDHLFVQRKKALTKSESLTYLVGALEDYTEQHYAAATEFGGQTTKTMSSPQVPVNYTSPDGFE